MNLKRVKALNNAKEKKGPVVYWMSRDQRVHDNWALLYAQKLANESNVPLVVLFTLTTKFLDAAFRQYDFMLKGLMQLENELSKYGIAFYMKLGEPLLVLPEFLKSINAGKMITEFDPLRIKRVWKRDVIRKMDILVYEVDAHNIIPCTFASSQAEYAAYTLRPKVYDLLPEFMDEYPEVEMQKNSLSSDRVDWEKIYSGLEMDRSVKEVSWILPGEESAGIALEDFLNTRFNTYHLDRNNPEKNSQSGLSPYIHFGQISAQRIVLNIQKFNGDPEAEKVFLEELIVRRELSDNFCYYNTKYDSLECFPDWAKLSLEKHKKDQREFVYSSEDFERAGTHEDLWNAAQNELLLTGKMHGYMRMYWAKKILEWSSSPEEALKIAIYLNDRYSLDGRDPNGYVGCAWSIGGVHDRPWNERPVTGTIRYMSYNGARRKFDVDAYIKKVNEFTADTGKEEEAIK